MIIKMNHYRFLKYSILLFKN